MYIRKANVGDIDLLVTEDGKTPYDTGIVMKGTK